MNTIRRYRVVRHKSIDVERNDNKQSYINNENLLHDLKTQINILYNTVKLMELLNLFDGIQDNSRKHIDNITKGVLRSTEILQASNNTIYQNLSLQTYDIVKLIKDIVLEISILAEIKNISVCVTSDKNKEDIVIDKIIFERILLNLITNSIKFTEPNGKIYVLISSTKTEVVIVVKDTGIGIGDMSTIFERYVTYDSNLGTGIGLSIVYEMVELLNGTVSAKNNENGIGTSVTIKIPFSNKAVS